MSCLKVVLTGGPSAGKTSISNVLFRSHPDQVIVVPEAASILYGGGFPRGREVSNVVCQQRAIFYVQRELEEIARLNSAAENRNVIICDRGSLDGLAYWPLDEASFFSSFGSTMEMEVARYDWVIHLDTAAPANYERSQIRTEGTEEAFDVNERVRKAWRLHPRRLIIPNHPDFLVKVQHVIRVIRAIETGADYETTQRLLNV